MAELRHFVAVETPVATVWGALVTSEGIAGWWTPDNVMPGEEGAVAEFRFGDRYHDKMRIVRLDPNRRVEWECLEGDREWVGTTLRFDLEETIGKTLVRFTHGGWREETDFFASCNTIWGQYMASLKRYCETGAGTPFS